MFCMEERKAIEWEEHLKKRIAWSTPLPGAKIWVGWYCNVCWCEFTD